MLLNKPIIFENDSFRWIGVSVSGDFNSLRTIGILAAYEEENTILFATTDVRFLLLVKGGKLCGECYYYECPLWNQIGGGELKEIDTISTLIIWKRINRIYCEVNILDRKSCSDNDCIHR